MEALADIMSDVSLREFIAGEIQRERELRELKITEMEKAIVEAKQRVDERLEAMNELRRQIASERGSFLLREVYDRLHAQFEERVRSLENARSNWEGRIWMIGAGFAILQVGILIVSHVWTKAG